jgi:hypothetical protein
MSLLFESANKGKLLFYTLSMLVVGLILMYAFFVNQTILNVVERRDFQRDIAILSTKVGGLETEYIQKKNGITLEYAYTLGFYNVEEPNYISTKDTNVLTLNEEL